MEVIHFFGSEEFDKVVHAQIVEKRSLSAENWKSVLSKIVHEVISSVARKNGFDLLNRKSLKSVY